MSRPLGMQRGGDVLDYDHIVNQSSRHHLGAFPEVVLFRAMVEPLTYGIPVGDPLRFSEEGLL